MDLRWAMVRERQRPHSKGTPDHRSPALGRTCSLRAARAQPAPEPSAAPTPGRVFLPTASRSRAVEEPKRRGSQAMSQPCPSPASPHVRTLPRSNHTTGRTSVDRVAGPPPGKCRPSPGWRESGSQPEPRAGGAGKAQAAGARGSLQEAGWSPGPGEQTGRAGEQMWQSQLCSREVLGGW